VGYTTDFDGRFTVTPPLKPEHKAYLDAFNYSRRMKRDADKAEKLPDPVRLAVNLPIGEEGEYYVGADEGKDSGILNYNRTPGDQPGLWCQWIPTEDGKYIEWDGGEKFYDYVEWLSYIIDHFLLPWGYNLNGRVEWTGEDSEDVGAINVEDCRVRVD